MRHDVVLSTASPISTQGGDLSGISAHPLHDVRLLPFKFLGIPIHRLTHYLFGSVAARLDEPVAHGQVPSVKFDGSSVLYIFHRLRGLEDRRAGARECREHCVRTLPECRRNIDVGVNRIAEKSHALRAAGGRIFLREVCFTVGRRNTKSLQALIESFDDILPCRWDRRMTEYFVKHGVLCNTMGWHADWVVEELGL